MAGGPARRSHAWRGRLSLGVFGLALALAGVTTAGLSVPPVVYGVASWTDPRWPHSDPTEADADEPPPEDLATDAFPESKAVRYDTWPYRWFPLLLRDPGHGIDGPLALADHPA